MNNFNIWIHGTLRKVPHVCKCDKCSHTYYDANDDEYHCMVHYCTNKPDPNCWYCKYCEFYKICYEEYLYFKDCEIEE